MSTKFSSSYHRLWSPWIHVVTIVMW